MTPAPHLSSPSTQLYNIVMAILDRLGTLRDELYIFVMLFLIVTVGSGTALLNSEKVIAEVAGFILVIGGCAGGLSVIFARIPAHLPVSRVEQTFGKMVKSEIEDHRLAASAAQPDQGKS